MEREQAKFGAEAVADALRALGDPKFQPRDMTKRFPMAYDQARDLIARLRRLRAVLIHEAGLRRVQR